MATDLYTVKVIDKIDKETVDLELQVTSVDSMIIEELPGFALMLLREYSSPKNLLVEEMSLDSLMDKNWAQKNARGYIVRAELVKEENKPLREILNDRDFKHPYYKDPSKWLKGVLRIKATHSAWIQHLEIGNSWNSTAFDPVGKNSYCNRKPITPSTQETSLASIDIDYSQGFFPVNRYILYASCKHIASNIPIMFPRYSEESYQTVDTIKKEDAITKEKLEKWIGKPVKLKNRFHIDMGILAAGEREGLILGSRTGYSGIREEELEWIGLAVLNSKKRKHNAVCLSYEKLVATTPVVTSIEVKNTTVIFTIVSFHSENIPVISSHAYYIDFISDSSFARNNELRSIMDKLKADKNINETSELNKVVANAFILGSHIKRTKEGKYLNDESLSWEERISIIQKENYPTWQLTIEVSDPCWIKHLAQNSDPNYLITYSNHQWDTEPWEGAALTEEDLKKMR
jgi:hypothetical protein